MTNCLNDEQMAAYVDNRLGPDERTAVERHLAACDRCLAGLALLKRVSDARAAFGDIRIPEAVLSRAEALIRERCRPSILEVIVQLTEDLLTVIRSTGEVLSGRQPEPVPVRGAPGPGRRVLVRTSRAGTNLTVEIESRAGRPVLRAILDEAGTGDRPEGVRVDLAGPGGLETRFTEAGCVDFGTRPPGRYRLRVEHMGDVDLELRGARDS